MRRTADQSGMPIEARNDLHFKHLSAVYRYRYNALLIFRMTCHIRIIIYEAGGDGISTRHFSH